jgi:hypothetical protein
VLIGTSFNNREAVIILPFGNERVNNNKLQHGENRFFSYSLHSNQIHSESFRQCGHPTPPICIEEQEQFKSRWVHALSFVREHVLCQQEKVLAVVGHRRDG